ncbi:MAG: hypothetical protein ACE148_09310 [Vicinamibacterales bacterium]
MVSGRKKVENRPWSTAYRGPIYINAGMTLDRDAVDWLHREMRLVSRNYSFTFTELPSRSRT